MKILFAWFLLATLALAGQPQLLVHCPTAGVIENGTLMTQLLVFPGDGMRGKVALGLWDALQIGCSYGAVRLMGRGSVDVDPMPGIELRFRIASEGQKSPAIMLGVDTQGYGSYDDETKRYEQKSRGAYAVVSKNWWALFGNLGLHGGINYSLEEKMARGFSAFVGIDKDIKDIIGMRLEYDLAPGDRDTRGKGRGYLSTAIALHFADNAWACFNFYDLLGNTLYVSSPSRELFVMFGMNLF